jgi:hypothetical protein
MSNPFFNIKRETIVTGSGLEIPNRFALLNEDTNDVLGIVSKNYELVMNQMVAELFDETLQKYPKSQVVDNLNANGSKWKRTIIFDHDDLKFDVTGHGDNINMAIRIFNGYDTKTSFGYELFGYRAICSNGLITGKKSLLSQSYQHFQNNPERLLGDFEAKFGAFNNNVLTWKRWTQLPFNKDQFKEFVSTRKYLGEKIVQAAIEYYEVGLNKFGMNDTRWGAFNVITDLMSNHTKARKGSNLFSNGYKQLEHMAEDFYTLPIPEEGGKTSLVLLN